MGDGWRVGGGRGQRCRAGGDIDRKKEEETEKQGAIRCEERSRNTEGKEGFLFKYLLYNLTCVYSCRHVFLISIHQQKQEEFV